MGQVVGTISNIFRCNIAAIQSGGSHENTVLNVDELWLIDSKNQLTNSFSGKCDCYIIGNGATDAGSLEVKRLADDDLLQLLDVFKNTDTEDISQVKDGQIDDAYIASNGKIYGATTGTGYYVYYRKFTVATTVSYSITGSSIGIDISDTQPAKNETYTCVATSGSGTVNVPAGKWLAWGFSSIGGVVLTTQVTTMKEPVLKSEIEVDVQENSDNPVKSSGIYRALQDISVEGLDMDDFEEIEPDGIVANCYIAPSNSKVYSSNEYDIFYKYLDEETRIKYNVQDASESVAYHTSVPSENVQVTLVATSGNSGEASIEAGKYLLWVKMKLNPSCFVAEVIKKQKDIIDGERLVFQENIKQRKETRSSVMVDGSLCLNWYKNSSIAIIDITAATADTITVSSADAESFDSDDALVAVKHSDGSYTAHLFNISSNILTIQRKAGYDENADLSDAIKIQGMFDTANSGMGQHLSAFGYLAFANYIAGAIYDRTSIKQDNLVYGLNFNEQGDNAVTPYFKSGLLYDTEMNIIATPRYEKALFVGSIGSGYSNHAGVLQTNDYALIRTCYIRNYEFIQAVKDASVEFDLPSEGYLGNGYVEITGGCVNNSTVTGGVRVDVLEDGVSVYNTTMPLNVDGKIVCDNIDLRKAISVRFTLLENSLTQMILTGIYLYQAAAGKAAVPTIKPTDKIAIIGNSWTQFPPSTGVVEAGNTYNTIDTLANGLTAGGYCYLPKELSRLLGVTIDNYGKSNMTADYGIEQLANIISEGKHYDYIFLEFYINDRTANIDANVWLSKMAQLVAMCKSINAKPIILGPTSTNSINQSVGLLSWWHALRKGLNL